MSYGNHMRPIRAIELSVFAAVIAFSWLCAPGANADPGQSQTKTYGPSQAATQNKNVENKPIEAADKKDKTKSKSTLDSYLDDQLVREKNKHHQYFEGLAKNVTETGDYQAARLRAQAGAGKNMPRYTPNDNAYMPMSARVPGYTPTPGTVPPRTPQYVSQDLEYAKMKEQMAEEKAAQLRKVSADKEASLDQTLANMKSQMKASHVPGAAVAKPEGSNLFVRYYGPSDTTKPYEVHPAAARIVPHQ
jgi:hypothetical protein